MTVSFAGAWLRAGVCLAAIAVAASGGSAAATPTANRVWVSGHGVDQAGCGAPTAPCRSLQYAHDNVAGVGGEIDILDPAGYGAITITKAISIVNDGVGTAGVQATSGNAITVNAGSGAAVYLKGLSIDGVHASAANGVQLNSAGELTIVNCVARNFANAGILLTPTTAANINVVDTLLTDNLNGLSYSAMSTNVSNALDVEHVLANDNQTGIVLYGTGPGALLASIASSRTDNNSYVGLSMTQSSAQAGGFVMTINLDSIHSDDNLEAGLLAVGDLTANLNRSVMVANGSWGVSSSALSGGGAIYSFGDNLIRNNGTADVNGTLTVATLR